VGDMRDAKGYKASKKRDKFWIDQIVADMKERNIPITGGRDADCWMNYKTTNIMIDFKYPFEVENILSDNYYKPFRGFCVRGNMVVLLGVRHFATSPKDAIQAKFITPYWETHWHNAKYGLLLDFIHYVTEQEDKGEIKAYSQPYTNRLKYPRFITPSAFLNIIYS
jgi:hypothetical protein